MLFWRVVTFPLVLAGDEREALLRAVDRLGVELGYIEGEPIPGAESCLGGEGGAMIGSLSYEDELLVAGVRRGLAKIASALDCVGPSDSSEDAAGAALDSVEMVMRGELMMGNAGQLPTLTPGFVYLVILPMVSRDRALEISQRAAELIASSSQH